MVQGQSLRAEINNCSHSNFRKHALLTSRSLLNELMLHIDHSNESIYESVNSECHRVYYLLKIVRDYRKPYNDIPIQVIYIGKHKQDITRPMLHLRQVVSKMKKEKLGVQVERVKTWLLQTDKNEVAIVSVPLCSEILAFSVEDYLLDQYKTNPNSGRKTVKVDENVQITAAKLCDAIVRARHRANDYDHITTYNSLSDKSILYSTLQ